MSETSIPFKGMVAMFDVNLIKFTKHKIHLNSLIYDAFNFFKQHEGAFLMSFPQDADTYVLDSFTLMEISV
jgi:hypothetical protein